jgi:RNA polymerase sigma factor (sigma-70 family)
MKIDELIDGCKNKNPRAQTKFYDLFYKKMVMTASKYLAKQDDKQAAEDIAQDCFIKILSTFTTFTGKTESSLTMWVKTIVRNKALDLYRKNKKLISVEVNEKLISDTDEDKPYEDLFQYVPKLIDDLSPQFKRVVTMYYLENKKHHEIAEILGISVSTSKTNLLKSKIKMKKNLLSLHTID